MVHTFCGGPSWTGRAGPVLDGQTVAVVPRVHGRGDTGLFSSVRVWFTPVPGGPRPTQMVLTRYHTRVALPASVRVPCDGTGTVVFSSCPYRAPRAAGWVPDVVDVQLVNVSE